MYIFRRLLVTSEASFFLLTSEQQKLTLHFILKQWKRLRLVEVAFFLGLLTQLFCIF